MKQGLLSIINQLRGIAYSDLSMAERNILHIAAGSLGLQIKVTDDKITTEEQ